MKTLLGKKLGMTQIFTEQGAVVPVTVIEAGPATVTQIKTVETDGYDAVQIGFEDAKPQRVNKPMTGHFAKNEIAPKKYLAEFKADEGTAYDHKAGPDGDHRILYTGGRRAAAGTPDRRDLPEGGQTDFGGKGGIRKSIREKPGEISG